MAPENFFRPAPDLGNLRQALEDGNVIKPLAF